MFLHQEPGGRRPPSKRLLKNWNPVYKRYFIEFIVVESKQHIVDCENIGHDPDR